MLRICMVGAEIGPSEEGGIVGGVANNVIRVSKALSERGHEIHLVTTPARYSGGALLDEPWIATHAIRVNAPYSTASYGYEFVFRAILQIRSLHRRNRIDVVNGHSGVPALAVVPAIAAKALRIPAIHTLYCPVGTKEFDKPPLQPLQGRFLVRRLLSAVDRVAALTNNIKESVESVGVDEGRIRVIPPAIDTTVFNPQVSGDKLRASLGIGRDDKLILFVGNLTKTKGIHVLIRSFGKVVNEFPKAELLIVTHASKEMLAREMRAILPTINTLHLERNVAFMGITSRFPEVLAACDVFVVPFLNTLGPSDLPLPLVEAMAMAKPVVATKVGGISELLTEESGSLTTPNSPSHLAHAIMKVLRNRRAAQTRATKASESVRKRFSVSRVAKITESLFEEVARLR